MNALRLEQRLANMLRARGFSGEEIFQLIVQEVQVEHALFALLYGGLPCDGIARAETPDMPATSWAWRLPPESFTHDAHQRLENAGFTTVGLLQLATKKQVEGCPWVGRKTVKAAQRYLESRGLRFTLPSEDIRERALSVYNGALTKIPIEYLEIRSGIGTTHLHRRGIHWFYHLADIPFERLLIIPEDYNISRRIFSQDDIVAIRRELALLWPF